MLPHQRIHVVRLQDHTHVHKRIQADIEMLPSDIKRHNLTSQFDIGKAYSIRKNTVAEHPSDGIATTQSLVNHTLHEQRIQIRVLIKRTLASYRVLHANTIRQHYPFGVKLHVMPEGGVQPQMIVTGRGLLPKSSIKSSRIRKKHIGIDAAVGALSLVARIKRETHPEIWMPTSSHFLS